jgi:hypothetical protein
MRCAFRKYALPRTESSLPSAHQSGNRKKDLAASFTGTLNGSRPRSSRNGHEQLVVSDKILSVVLGSVPVAWNTSRDEILGGIIGPVPIEMVGKDRSVNEAELPRDFSPAPMARVTTAPDLRVEIQPGNRNDSRRRGNGMPWCSSLPSVWILSLVNAAHRLGVTGVRAKPVGPRSLPGPELVAACLAYVDVHGRDNSKLVRSVV